MRLLITGLPGFVGTHLVAGASVRGDEVIALTRRSDPAAKLSAAQSQIEVVDLTDWAAVAAVMRHWSPEAVLHAAARIPAKPDEDIRTFFDDNLRATINVLHAAYMTGVKRVVLSSSMSVYGMPHYLPVDEQHPTNPSADYGYSKLAGDLYGRLCVESYGLCVTVLRYSGIYGRGQQSGAIPAFIDRCLRHAPLTLHAGGHPSSDYVWIEDVVQANLLALDASEAARFQVFNIGSGIELSIGALAELIRRLCKSKSDIRVSDVASPRDFKFVYNIERARSLLSYAPTDPEVAIRKFIRQRQLGQS